MAGDIPKPHGGIHAAGDQRSVVRGKRQASDAMVVTSQRRLLDAGGDVPKLDGHVVASRGQHFAVMAEGQRPDGTRMTELSPFPAARHIPQLDRVVVTTGRHRLAVRRVRERAYHVGVARERGQLLAHSPVPELHRSIVAAGGEELAVRRKGHGLDRGAMSRQRDELPAGSGLPHFGGVVVARRRDVPAVSRIGHIGECQRVPLQDDARLRERGERKCNHHQEPAERRQRQCYPGPS